MSHQPRFLNLKADEAVKRPNAPTVSANTGDLYDPDSQHPSWEPQADALPPEVILRPSKRYT